MNRVLAVAATAALSSQTFAQGATDTAKAKVTATSYESVKFAPAESPAFTFLGVSPSKVSRPPSVQDLGTEVLNGIGSDGRVKQGIALEIAPYFYLGQDITLKDYQRKGDWKYALATTRISLGTVRTQGDTGSTDFAIGLRTVFVDESDPMRNPAVTKAMGDGFTACAKALTGPDATQAYEDCITKATKNATKGIASQWNARRIALTVVVGQRLPKSEFRNLTGTGMRAWLGYSERLSTNGQLIFSGTYRQNRAATADSDFSAVSIGARLNLGSERANAFLEGVAESRFKAGSAVQKGTSGVSAGVEFRAADGVWVSTGFGNAYESVKKADHVVMVLGIRWGTSAAQRLDPTK